jgi:hypothetical protein
MIGPLGGNQPQVIVVQALIFPESGEDQFYKSTEYVLNARLAGDIRSPGVINQAVGAIGFYQGVDTLAESMHDLFPPP